jgi:osmotically-inducible protein OsmY
MFARVITVVGIVLALLAPTVAHAAGAPAASQDNNLRLFRSIQRTVLEYPHYTVFDMVRAEIENGVVTLAGKVTMPYKRDEIARRVTGVNGVREVRNLIEVLPASKSDDELRLAIARAIYGHPTFRHLATRVNPPIHVIVERGRVTLQGVVMNEGDRLIARSIARSFNAFEVKDELRTEADAQNALETLSIMRTRGPTCAGPRVGGKAHTLIHRQRNSCVSLL